MFELQVMRVFGNSLRGGTHVRCILCQADVDSVYYEHLGIEVQLVAGLSAIWFVYYLAMAREP